MVVRTRRAWGGIPQNQGGSHDHLGDQSPEVMGGVEWGGDEHETVGTHFCDRVVGGGDGLERREVSGEVPRIC